LCTLVPDLPATPDIKLWIPTNCKDFCELWLSVMDALPALYAHKQSGETTEKLIERLATIQPPPAEFERVFQHFAAPTGHNRKGAPLYARLDHRIGKAKAFSESLAVSTAAAGTTPAPMEIHDDSPEMQDAIMESAVAIAIERGEDARMADGEDTDEVEGVHAVMGPPSVGGLESVPQPTRIKVNRPPPTRKRKAMTGGDGYTWEASDRRDAADALLHLRALRSAYPPDGQLPSEEKLIDMFALWYKYFVFTQGAAHAPGGHGLKTRNTRINYGGPNGAMARLTSPAGRAIFTSLDCLPKANDQAERHRFRDLVVRYYASLRGGAPGSLATNPDSKEINNTVSWVMKYLDMFPPGDLTYFVRSQPVPSASRTSSGRRSSASHTVAGSSSAPNIVDLDDDDDNNM